MKLSLNVSSLAVTAILVVTLVASHDAFAQSCKPVNQRTGELGCWITANASLGQLPQQPIFWHLDTYLTRGEAEAAKGPRGTMVESLGKLWLLHDRRGRLASVWRAAHSGNRSASSERNGELLGAIHGGRFHTWHDGACAPAFWSRGLVHVNRRDVFGNS